MRTLSPREQRGLGRRLRRSRWLQADSLPADVALDPDDADQHVCAIGDPVIGYSVDRGVAFPGDWVRWCWVVAAPGRFLEVAATFARSALGIRATHLRWQLPLPDARHERMWERLGARLVALDREAGTVVWELGPARPRQRTKRGFVLAPPRLTDLEKLAQWAQMPEVYGPLGYDEGPTHDELEAFLYPESPNDRTLRAMRFYAVRQGDALVGLCNEHDWDYFDDSVRELDLALPGLQRRSAGAVMDIIGGLMHRCYDRGATQTFANMRAGASNAGFPRLFSRVGAADVTAEVDLFGAAVEGRRYYAATREAFYSSPVGRRFAGG